MFTYGELLQHSIRYEDPTNFSNKELPASWKSASIIAKFRNLTVSKGDINDLVSVTLN